MGDVPGRGRQRQLDARREYHHERARRLPVTSELSGVERGKQSDPHTMRFSHQKKLIGPFIDESPLFVQQTLSRRTQDGLSDENGLLRSLTVVG